MTETTAPQPDIAAVLDAPETREAVARALAWMGPDEDWSTDGDLGDGYRRAHLRAADAAIAAIRGLVAGR